MRLKMMMVLFMALSLLMLGCDENGNLLLDDGSDQAQNEGGEDGADPLEAETNDDEGGEDGADPLEAETNDDEGEEPPFDPFDPAYFDIDELPEQFQEGISTGDEDFEYLASLGTLYVNRKDNDFYVCAKTKNVNNAGTDSRIWARVQEDSLFGWSMEWRLDKSGVNDHEKGDYRCYGKGYWSSDEMSTSAIIIRSDGYGNKPGWKPEYFDVWYQDADLAYSVTMPWMLRTKRYRCHAGSTWVFKGTYAFACSKAWSGYQSAW